MRTVPVFLVSLLIPALPTLGAARHNGVTNVVPGVQVNHGLMERARDTIRVVPRAPLDLSHIFENVKNALFPHPLDATAVKEQPEDYATLEPPQFDFWEAAKASEKSLGNYVHHLLEDAAAYFNSTKFIEISSTMTAMVNASATFRNDIAGTLSAHNVTFDTFSNEFGAICMTVLDNLEKVCSSDQAGSQAKRVEMVSKVLEDISRELVELATRHGIDQDVVNTYASKLRSHAQKLIDIVGSINEECPELFPAIAFSVVGLLVPESWILQPVLSVFGFGPLGPIKGTFAAWSQSYFWGAKVGAGSWFAALQAAGMGVVAKWLTFVTKVSVLAPAVAAGATCLLRHH